MFSTIIRAFLYLEASLSTVKKQLANQSTLGPFSFHPVHPQHHHLCRADLSSSWALDQSIMPPPAVVCNLLSKSPSDSSETDV